MRLSFFAVLASAVAVAACGGGGHSSGGGGFGGFGPSARLLPNPGGAADSLNGQAVALCDWDGDGLPDAFVGAPGTSNGAGSIADAGAVRLWYGRRCQGGRSRPRDSGGSWFCSGQVRCEGWRSGGDASTVLSLVFADWCRRTGVRRRALRLHSRVRSP